MSNDLSSLNEDHIRQLGRIIETLEKSAFDYLQIEVGELKVTVGKGNVTMPQASPQPAPSSAQPVATAAPPAPQAGIPAVRPASAPPTPASGQAGTIEITTAIMGMFYAQPEPGAAPFVTLGSSVVEDSTVGLVEVMKTFNAVTAGVCGTVVEVCVRDSQLVEYGQVLFRVLPE